MRIVQTESSVFANELFIYWHMQQCSMHKDHCLYCHCLVCVHRPPRWRNTCLLRFIHYGMISKRKASPQTSTWRVLRPYRPRWGIMGCGISYLQWVMTPRYIDIYIYLKICSPLFSFLKFWSKQQGLEVSASSFLHVGFVMCWSHCAMWNAAGSYLDCFMSALMNVKDGSVTGSWRLCSDTGFTDRHHWTRSKLNFSINTSQEMSLYEDMWICRWTPKHSDLLLLSEYRLKSVWFSRILIWDYGLLILSID